MPVTEIDGRREKCLDWARDQVGVAPGASLDEVRRRFFAAVEMENFVPDATLDRAFRTLRWEAEGVVAEDPAEFIKAEESRLQDEVAAYASKMFSLPVGQRRQTWADLRGRCERAPQAAARLDALAPGLDVELNALDPSGRAMHLNTLARYAAELFPLRPTARAVRRHAILQTLHKDDVKPWRKAAVALQKKHPRVAALAPEFIGTMTTAGQAPRRVSVQVRSTSPNKGKGWALVLAALIFASFIGRAAMISKRHTSPYTPYQFTPSAPISPFPQNSEQQDPFTDLQRLIEQSNRGQQELQREQIRKALGGAGEGWPNNELPPGFPQSESSYPFTTDPLTVDPLSVPPDPSVPAPPVPPPGF